LTSETRGDAWNGRFNRGLRLPTEDFAGEVEKADFGSCALTGSSRL